MKDKYNTVNREMDSVKRCIKFSHCDLTKVKRTVKPTSYSIVKALATGFLFRTRTSCSSTMNLSLYSVSAKD